MKLKFVLLLWSVNINKSHQPLSVSMPRIHTQHNGGDNIQHKIRDICFKCLRKSWELFWFFFLIWFRRSLRKSTLSSTQRTETNCSASRTSSPGRYLICYNILLDVMQQTYTCVTFIDQSVGSITFTVFIDPITRWRHPSPWEEGDWWLAAFPRAHGGMFQRAEEESGEGVRSERAGEV